MVMEMTKDEYDFFNENAPSSVFEGEGTSMAIIGKDAIDFDISEVSYNEEREKDYAYEE